MQIANLISPNTIKTNLKSQDKTSVITELAELLNSSGKLSSMAQYLEDVIAREELFSTGIGFGIAIPHGKSEGVKEAFVAFGKSEKGVDFCASDGSLAHMIFLIAVPLEQSGTMHLEILAKLSRMLMHDSFREELRKATNTRKIMEVLSLIDVDQ